MLFKFSDARSNVIQLRKKKIVLLVLTLQYLTLFEREVYLFSPCLQEPFN